MAKHHSPLLNNNNITLELSLNSSMVENNTTTIKKPTTTLNFDPSLTLTLSGDHRQDVDHRRLLTTNQPACDHGGLYRQDSVSVGSSLISVASVCVKREREVKSEESERVISKRSDQVEEDDDNCMNDRKKLRLTKAQSALLEEAFKHHTTLNPKQKQELAKELKLRPRQVEVWFQNRRARTKLKQTEVDCEYLKKCCEALKEENTRLNKELQELKALKLSTQPVYMQLPAATLTRCPSCERNANGDATSSAKTATARSSFTVAQKPRFFNPFTNPSAAC